MRSLKSLWMCLVIVAIVAGVGCQQRDEPARQTPLAYTLEESHLLQSYVDGLAEIAKTSPMADTLLAFYHREATLARHKADGLVVVLSDAKSPHYFLVTPIPQVHTELSTTHGTVAARYQDRVMSLYSNNLSPFARGLLLAHELVHARDEILYGEPPSEPLSAVWLVGESNAHYALYTILNEFTANKWRDLAIESAHERRTWALENGYSDATMICNPVKGDSARMVSLFGQQSVDDQAMLLTQFTVDATMLNLKEVAAEDMEKYQNLSGEFMYVFYSRYVDH